MNNSGMRHMPASLSRHAVDRWTVSNMLLRLWVQLPSSLIWCIVFHVYWNAATPLEVLLKYTTRIGAGNDVNYAVGLQRPLPLDLL